jgi:cytochrome c oxidase subunit 2
MTWNYIKTSLSALLIGLNLFFIPHPAAAAWQTNMPRGVTPLSHAIYDLHMLVFWICVAIAVIVFGIMLFSLIRHRKSRGVTPAQFHEHPVLEIAWAIVPFIILIAIAVPATKTLIKMNDNSNPDLTIKVTGYQWRWRYAYLDQGIDFFSNLSTPTEELQNRAKKNPWYLLEVDHPLVVPIHKKIRFLFTSNDVIHSWWIPTLGIKRDTIPGFINEAWARIEKEGIYRGQCAELCGTNHAFMPIVVQAVSESAFNQWVKQQENTSHGTNT